MKLKIILTTILWTLYGIAYETIAPLITTRIAINQFQNTNTSFTNYVLCNSILNNFWIALLIITILIFRKNIKNIFK